jgi:hypothetical protein
MQAVGTLADVGHFDFEVFGSGRSGRHSSSRFRARCAAIALHGDEILLLSVAGPETSVKADRRPALLGQGSEADRLLCPHR